MDPKGRRSDLALAALAVGGTVFVLILPALIRGEGFLPVGSLWRVPPWNAVLPRTTGNGLLIDQLLQLWPWRLFLQGELIGGRFPLWNPLLAGGVPFAGCVQAAPFFPTNFLLLALAPAAWSLAAAYLKLCAAGAFAALHARRLGAGRAGAALSGVAFALCGFMLAWLGHPQTNAACLLPALFWAVGRAHERRGARAWVPVAVVSGLILLGGHPPTALHLLAAGAAYAWFLRPGRGALPYLWAVLAGAALAGPALLPWLEYLSWSSTGAASAALARWSTRLSPWTVLHLLMPLASGSPGHGAEALAAAFGLDSASNFVERAGWIGLPALSLAVLAWLRRSGEREVRFHAALALFGLAAAFGLPPLPWLWRLLPGFSSANPTRLLVLFCFGASILAGLGCDPEGAAAPPRLTRGFAAGFALALFVYFAAVGRLAGGFAPSELGFAAGQAVAFVLESVAALWLLAVPRTRRWAPLIAALFLLRAGLGVNPTAPVDLLYPPTPGIEALAGEQGQGRVFGLGWALAPDTGMVFGLRDARGRDFASLKRYEELVTGTAGSFDFWQTADRVPVSPPASLLAISAVAATEKTAGSVPPAWTPAFDGDLKVFRSPFPGRRAWFVPEARVAPSDKVLLAVRSPDFDLRRGVWLDDWFTAPVTAGARGGAAITSESSDEVNVAVESDGPGWLLLLDNWYPGWRAEVNGTPAAVRRADYTFRAVMVPKGKSTVKFSYVPYSFYLGLALAFLSALGLGWVWRRDPA